ncbi:arginine biosynthesis bifunctional protein ArgJ [Striga asiatica]|uniref:Arginine biosynthesis bifunctional protein ArgJ n=1 Tax=Striga asiatica TaxID=4170 RepID=A0A5A7QMF3_STRAF|nr:arginine biosynthesis bifunctional protein ArgJ [Striga asiatica]
MSSMASPFFCQSPTSGSIGSMRQGIPNSSKCNRDPNFITKDPLEVERGLDERFEMTETEANSLVGKQGIRFKRQRIGVDQHTEKKKGHVLPQGAAVWKEGELLLM